MDRYLVKDESGMRLNNRNDGSTNPFVGTPYESMWENNPYKDLYYEPSFWDNIGLSHKAKDANAEYERLYNEYIAGLHDQMRQDEYNDPSAEAQRMRDAGLNPDLYGLSGKSNTGAMSPPNSGPNSALTGQSPAFDGLGILTQVLGFATSAFKGIADLSNTMADTDTKSIDNFTKLFKLGGDVILDNYKSSYLYGSSLPHDSLKEGTSWFVPKRLQNKYKNAFDFALNFPERNRELLYGDLSNLEENRWKYGEKTGFSNYSDDDKVLFGYIGKIVDLQHKLQTNKLKADNADEFVRLWKSDVNGYLYKSFKKGGSVLAGLLLLGNGSINPTSLVSSSVLKAGSVGANMLSPFSDMLNGKKPLSLGQKMINDYFSTL